MLVISLWGFWHMHYITPAYLECVCASLCNYELEMSCGMAWRPLSATGACEFSWHDEMRGPILPTGTCL